MAPITFAHRGASAEAPGNTLEAFARAHAQGAGGIESDVRLSSDGVPVLAHDPVARSRLRRRRVDATTADELGAIGVPALEALYALVGGTLDISLDVKVPEAAAPAIEVARRLGDPNRLWLCSPDLAVLAALREHHDDVRLVHSTRRTAVDGSVERHAAELATLRIDAFNLHRSEWTSGLVVLFHRFDVRAFAWDVQEVRHLREALRFEVDAIYCDHVDRMVAVVSEWDVQGGGR